MLILLKSSVWTNQDGPTCILNWVKLNSAFPVQSPELLSLYYGLCASELASKVTELLNKLTIQLKTAFNTFQDDYLPPKFCWSLKAGAQSQHSLPQPVPKSGVSSTWTLHSVHPEMVTENEGPFSPLTERLRIASSSCCTSKEQQPQGFIKHCSKPLMVVNSQLSSG